MEDTKKGKSFNTDLYEFIKIRLDNFDKSNKQYAEYIQMAEDDSYNLPNKSIRLLENNILTFKKTRFLKNFNLEISEYQVFDAKLVFWFKF
jgi:hypothetical protein